eukprot:CFRG2188T1
MSKIFSTEKGLSVPTIEVASKNVEYTEEHITAKYLYTKNEVKVDGNKVKVTPGYHKYTFQTERKVRKTGLLLIGLGGNNGSTVTAAILANKNNVSWNGRTGKLEPNYFGSLTQASTIRLGSTAEGEEIHVPFNSLLPMVHPNDLVIGGWDINNFNMADATDRAAVLDYDLREKLRPELEKIVPMPSIYYPDFIAANQSDRANNCLDCGSKEKDLEKIRSDIREFKSKNDLDTVIVLWTANTERFTDVEPGLNMTADEVLNSIKQNKDEISPSNIFAVASILEGCPYINGSPQNTLVPGIIELSEKHNVFIGGDDFKSGQTKMKSVLMDFLVSAGIKVEAIASYNHLGNNDGKNLNAPAQFRSKEISKSNVVDDMVSMNSILYKEGEHPDHVVVIKYVPTVGDSKRALDEYTSRIFMNGMNTIVMHNTCEDSLLATPLIIDLAVMCELMTRIKYKTVDNTEWQSFKPVLSVLSYMLKAPLVPKGSPVVNALMKQQRCATNILSACIGLNPDHDMLLEHKTDLPAATFDI